MKAIRWGIPWFSISMETKYKNLYEVEEDIEKLYGSSNFSELEDFDWFLLSRENKELSFLSLDVPVLFYDINLFNLDSLDNIDNIELNHCIDAFSSNVIKLDKAYFSVENNTLIATSENPSFKYKTLISEDFYFLLGEGFSYEGFMLKNATNHVAQNIIHSNEEIFNTLLVRMLNFCHQNAYDAMDDEIHIL